MNNSLTEEQVKVLNMSQSVINEVRKVIIGKDEIIIKVLLSILAGGHILIEDIPGVGKTTLAVALSKALSLDYKRLQFTPDVLPTDVTGFTILNKETHKFEYKQGAALTNLFLADEINRTSSKTQSALLEVMEEGSVTVDGVTKPVPEPFIVLATQNPVEQEGTYKLPEAQLDRFLMKITMGYPSLEEEVDILERHHANASLVKLESLAPVLTKEELLSLRRLMEHVFVDRTLLQYIALIVQQTRTSKAVY